MEEILQYLSSSELDPFFAIDRIIRDTSHSQYDNLINFCGQIEDNEIIKILDDRRFQAYGKITDNINIEGNARIWYCKNNLNKIINKKRFEALINTSGNVPLPYNHAVLKSVKTDSNWLVSLSEFEISNCSLIREDKIFYVLPSLPHYNSMYWAFNQLLQLSNRAHIKIRLDPFLIIERIKHQLMHYKMYVYGVPPDLDKLSSIEDVVHVRWMAEDIDKRDEQFTDAVWEPRKDGIHFICEEVPKKNANYYRGSRYFHSIYNADKEKFIHTDGAIRIYSDSEIEERLNCHVRNIGKVGKRIKIFQIDTEIDLGVWSNIAGSFFVWNEDVMNYFKYQY
jgi:hypothetical protein